MMQLTFLVPSGKRFIRRPGSLPIDMLELREQDLTADTVSDVHGPLGTLHEQINCMQFFARSVLSIARCWELHGVGKNDLLQ